MSRESELAYCIEAVDARNFALWTTYAVIVQIVGSLESRIQQFPAEPRPSVYRIDTISEDLPVPFPAAESCVIGVP
jgi:hypothetical protein